MRMILDATPVLTCQWQVRPVASEAFIGIPYTKNKIIILVLSVTEGEHPNL